MLFLGQHWGVADKAAAHDTGTSTPASLLIQCPKQAVEDGAGPQPTNALMET